jgi:Xaa-Pro aminopeptidase
LSDIRPFPPSREFSGVIPESAARIGMTFDVVPAQQRDYYAKLLAGREFVDISLLNRQLRSVKSAGELELLRRSGASLSAVFAEVPQFLAAGMREIDLAAEFECRLRKAGSEGYVRMRAFNQELFQGLAVSTGGPSFGFFDGAVTGRGLSNASPHGASLETVAPNTPVLFDYTGVFQGYITDMTRIFVIGDLDEELKHAFEVSLSIQEMLRASLKPGAICEELFLLAAEMAEKAGLKDNFMGMPGEQARFVGHGVGLELDEFPVLAQGFKMPLQQGQTVAIEPKFVFPDKGVVGIENTFAVTAEGGEKMTDLPDNIVFL